ncbi:hypothetical protein [Nostoc sp. LEGE 12447]|uniref:DinB/UmuC family translesion DNA polymerase n=1 Tax=Nostoc sp. LEGE 12447 TaxID=1828640 RepID=UPI001D14FAA1|nr:hypothetical protein [Nostoc sp. LEGE 12447]
MFWRRYCYYYKIARAEDDRPVEANRVRKSIGAETSFAQDLSDVGQMLQELEHDCSNCRAKVREA